MICVSKQQAIEPSRGALFGIPGTGPETAEVFVSQFAAMCRRLEQESKAFSFSGALFEQFFLVVLVVLVAVELCSVESMECSTDLEVSP